MYLGQEKEQRQYSRASKLGHLHAYTRTRVYLIFRCDCCSQIFSRLKEKMDPKRISNNYFHCCTNCNSKKFAQRKGVERRKIWDIPVSSDLDISRF